MQLTVADRWSRVGEVIGTSRHIVEEVLLFHWVNVGKRN